MESLSDPETLLELDDVAVVEEETVVDAEEFEEWELVDGLVAVGVVREAGDLLLVNVPGGWSLPITAVEPEEDWLSVGRRGVEVQTGIPVEIDGVERVTRIQHRLEGTDDTRTTYEVVLAASPFQVTALAFDDDASPDYVSDAKWFDAVPEDTAEGIRGEDVRLFLE